MVRWRETPVHLAPTSRETGRFSAPRSLQRRHESGTTLVMPSTGSFELSLINDTPSLPPYAPLTSATEVASAPDAVSNEEAPHADSFDELDCGLTLGPGESETIVSQEPPMSDEAADDYGELYDQPAHPERHVTLTMAAVVLVACLTAGAAAAAFVFTAG